MRCDYASNVPYILVGGLSDQIWLGILLPLDLTPAGATGCSIYTSQEIQAGSYSAGMGVQVTIPRDPTLVDGTLHWQALQLDFALQRALPLATSNYVSTTVLR